MPRTITVGLDGSPESHATSLPVVHSWNPPPYYAYGLSCDLELHTRQPGRKPPPSPRSCARGGRSSTAESAAAR